MKVIILFAASALLGYIIGYLAGRWTAAQEIEEKRAELDIDEEGDLFDELFK